MPNLSYRKPRIANLGQVFGLVYRANEKAIALDNEITEDLRAYAAPSECADVAYNGCDRVIKTAIQAAQDITGMKWPDIMDEIQARTGGRWFAWTMYQSLIPDPCMED